ncbi:hypothetical protein ATY77_11795 [Rhizobium sp. R634]|uniref:hypothetical protein n=1 Tax=Rhizobium sp. R634 TaxID=1764274 RepID=UPI000B530F42|nr:hypothetical protein [Rhizobium sp. R634]OWV72194.1 hypothetical protein ATY77_11795 [Rhizobium sp. R634]
MRIGLILSVLSLVALPLDTAVSQTKEGWREYPHLVKVFNEDNKAKYSLLVNDHVTKRDVFIFSEAVTINEPVLTNGGDVIIAANDVYINAPIDTRIYFKYKYLYWQPYKKNSRAYGIITYYEKPIVRSFNYYYNWMEYYDDVGKVYSFKGFEGPEDRHRANEYVDKVLEVPQLPSAPMLLVPTEVNRQVGGDAPDHSVVWPSVRSGSIRIYASRIHFCETCLKSMEVDHPPITGGDPYDETRAVFLHVGGLKGGRGGAGMTTACSYHPSAQTDACDIDRPKRGALSGKPGRGGDAGEIFVKFVGREPSAQERSDLRLASNVQGGRPSHIAQKRTPKFKTLYDRPSRAIFSDEVPVHEGNLFGSDGRIDIFSINTDEAISELYALLAKYETNGNYAIAPLLRMAMDNPAIFSFSPRDLLAILLEEEMTLLQQELLTALPGALRGAKPIRSNREFFSSLSCSDEMSLYTELIDSLLHEICNFRTLNDLDFVRSYLFRIGGIYREGEADVNVGIRQNDTLSKLDNIAVIIRKSLAQQKEIHLMLYDSMKQEQRDKIEVAIRAVNEQRRQLLQTVEDRKKAKKGFDKLVAPMEKVADGVGKLYTKAISGQWATAGQQVFAVVKDISDLRLVDYGMPPADTADIDERLSALKRTLRRFMEATAQVRAEMLASANVNLREIADLRWEIKSRQLTSKLRFPNYIRASIQEFIRTNVDADRVLKSNLALIDQSLEGVLRVPTELDVTAPKQSCGPNEKGIRLQDAEGPLGCVRMSSIAATSALVVSGDWLRDFPLFVIEPGKNTFRIDLEFAFDRKDLSFETMDFSP